MGLIDEHQEARAALATAWSTLPPAFQLPTQFLGRHYAGCGATIGAMPRCDFTCRGCYLGEDANRMRPLPLVELKAQMRQIRTWLGPAGNLQITDGEVTLRKTAELVDLISYARSIGLVPMLMTHGETFRRRPRLLDTLLRDAGLSEVCFHIDSTMRGRRDAYADARCENDLTGLRVEFAELVRGARRRTGRPLTAASTVTVTRETLDEVPAIVRWFLANADAFKMVSFQPLAAVGRSDGALAGVTADALWARIAEGAGDPDLLRGVGYLGHSDCSRFVQGVAARRGGQVHLVPLYRQDDVHEMDLLKELLDRMGGMSMRLDGRFRSVSRLTYLLARHGVFIARRVAPYLWRLARRTGTWRTHYFCVVSHHFMNAAETASTLGQERLAACSFRVPIAGRMEPMCAANALGLRDAFYRAA